MASTVPPKRNTAFTTYVFLSSQSQANTFQANPTLAAGDVLVCTDDGAPANAATLPTVDADHTKRVKVSLSASEMNGDVVTVLFSDVSGAEWKDFTLVIHTAAQTLDETDAVVDSVLEDTGTTIPAQITALNDVSAAEVNAEVDTALADYDAPTKAELDAGLAALNDPTAGDVADAVWDEAKAGHVGAGSFGEEVQAHALSSELPSVPTAADIRAEIDANSTQLAQILTDIGNLGDITVAEVLAGTVEGDLDLQETLRIMLAVLAGKSGGGGTATITFRDQADSKARVTATVDANGNRTAIGVDGS